MIKIGRRGSPHRTAHGRRACRATSPIRISPTTRSPASCALLDALLRQPLDARHRALRRRPTSRSRRSTSATPPPTSSRPTARAAFNIRFNDRWTPRDPAATRSSAACGEAAGGASGSACRFEPTNARRLPDGARSRSSQLVADAVAAETGPSRQLSTTGGTSDARFIVDALPGRRVRPRRPDHAPGRRARGRRRPRPARVDLSPGAGRLYAGRALKGLTGPKLGYIRLKLNVIWNRYPAVPVLSGSSNMRWPCSCRLYWFRVVVAAGS